MPNIHTSGSPLDEAADTLKKAIIQHTKKDTLLLFSGGSALALVEHIHPKLLSSRHTISVLDEHFTDEDDESNFAKLAHTPLLKKADSYGAHILDPRPQNGETLEETARRFDLALKHWHVTHREGVVIITMGIGPDGHTAGILPMAEDTKTFAKLFLDEKRCAVGYETMPEKNPFTERITATLTYLTRHVEHATVFATGTQKRDALHAALYGSEELASMPAKILRDMKQVDLFTDLSLE